MNPVVIVGAGIAGCVTARELARQGREVILVEKKPFVGGLAATYRYGDYGFDIGPHRFFTRDERVLYFIKDILGNDFYTIPRHSEVFFLGKYYSWPLKPSLLLNLPIGTAMKSAWDLILMGMRKDAGKNETFEDYILTHYGPSLYNIFFKEYTEKFLGCPANSIHRRWAKEGMRRTIIDERIASRNLFDILKLFFNFRALKTEFIYPAAGIDAFCKRLAADIIEYGGRILTDTRIEKIKTVGNAIDKIYVGEKLVEPEYLIWSGSLDSLGRLLGIPPGGIEYLSTVIYNIELDSAPKRDFQWCYYGSKKIIFSRVSAPPAFSKRLVPKDKGSLTAEVTCRAGDPILKEPRQYIKDVERDLIRTRLLEKASDIRAIHAEIVEEAYPIYKIGYEEELKKTMARLDSFENLRMAGRTGLYWYNNMDDSVANGLALSDELALKSSEEIFASK